MTPAAPRGFFWSVVAVSLLIAILKRLPMIAQPGFPLGEGGLFVLFSESIVNSGFALPAAVVYGGVAIPFAYPPAAFYLAAWVSRGFGTELLSVYYWLPLALNLFAIPAFCFLAAQITRDRVILLCAAILYVQLPDSYVWQITGGGLPRSLAAIFALLAVGLALRITNKPDILGLLLCGSSVGLSILSHLEWGVFAAAGVSLAFLTGAGHWKRFIMLAAGTGLTALMVISPWMAAVLARHGLDPFLSSSSASQWSLGHFMSTSVSGRLFGLVVWPAMLGAFITLSRGNWFLILWTFCTLLLTPRMGGSAGLAISSSLLAGFGLKAAGDFAAAAMASRGRAHWIRLRLARTSLSGIGLSTLSVLVLFSVFLATPLRWLYHPANIAEQVDQPTRNAMRWVRERTEPGSTFVVISGAEAWWGDSIAEWFPYLADRSSVTTAQGLEWAGPGVFVEKLGEINVLKTVQAGAPDLTPSLVQRRYCAANYVAVFLPPESAARQAFLQSEFFQSVFESAEAAVFKGRPEGLCR